MNVLLLWLLYLKFDEMKRIQPQADFVYLDKIWQNMQY